PRRFTRNDEALDRLVQHGDIGDGFGRGASAVSARIVDNEDLVGGTGLSAKGVETTREQTRLVVRADDHGDRQFHASRMVMAPTYRADVTDAWPHDHISVTSTWPCLHGLPVYERVNS